MRNTIKFLKIKKLIEENSTAMSSDYNKLYKINDDYSVDFFIDTYISKSHHDILSTSLSVMSGNKNQEKLKSEIAFKCFPPIKINRCHRSFKFFVYGKGESTKNSRIFMFTEYFPEYIDGSLVMEIKRYDKIMGLHHFPKRIGKTLYLEWRNNVIEWQINNNDDTLKRVINKIKLKNT